MLASRDGSLENEVTQNGETYEFGVHIVVVSVHQGSNLAVGKRYEVRNFPVTLGRSLDAGVRLSDNTVSREHARLELSNGKLFVEAVSVRAKIWVNKEQVFGGDRIELTGTDTFLQLGGVLLRVTASPPTEPFQHPLAPPVSLESLLYVERTVDAVWMRLGGKDLQIHRGPAFIFAALAARPNEPIHESELLLAGGGDPDRALERNLNQMVTYVRNAIATVLESDDALRERVLHEAIEAARSCGDHWFTEDDALDLSPRMVARQLIKNQRNFGYTLRLPPHAVTVLDRREILE